MPGGRKNSLFAIAAASGIEFCPLVGRNVGDRRVLAELERPYVRNNGPAVTGADLLGIIGHSTEPVGYHVKEMADRRRPEPVDMERGGSSKSALDDHTLSITKAAVAWRAKDVEPLLSTVKDFCCNGQREIIYVLLARGPGQYVSRKVRSLSA